MKPLFWLPSPGSAAFSLGALAAAATTASPARGDTLLDFSSLPAGQGQNSAVIQSFGDKAAVSSKGVVVTGTGTPGIDLTWSRSPAGEWQYYVDSVWSAAQMDTAAIGKAFDITFTPVPGAGVVIKSFNLHPYYTSGTTYDYDWSVLDLDGNPLAGSSLTAVSDGTKTPVDVGFTGALGQPVVLRLVRTGGDGRGDSIALDDLLFSQIPVVPPAPVAVISSPAAGPGASPEILFAAAVQDGVLKVNPSTFALLLDGVPVTPVVTSSPGRYDIAYASSARLLPSGSTHSFELRFLDNVARTPHAYSSSVGFTVRAYQSITLPPPAVLETFSEVTEGRLPDGWSGISYVPGLDSNFDLQDLNSASYDGWTVIDSHRLTQPLRSYTGHVTTSDYQRVLTPNPVYAVNGSLVKELASGNILFNTSGYRSGPGQYGAVFTRDFDLTGKSDVALCFHSLWEQNQDSMAAVEYSIDQGATWMPVAYFLHTGDLRYDADNQIDALATLTATQPDTPRYVDPSSGETRGTMYGDFIQAPLDPSLAAYIQGRDDDNAVTSKRVEFFPLPAAANQPAVRLRFAHAGTDSWYWGIDDVGLYSMPHLDIVSGGAGGGATLSWTGDGRLFRAAELEGPWAEVPAGELNGKSYALDAAHLSGRQYFRVQ